jgi:hypothetical protein
MQTEAALGQAARARAGRRPLAGARARPGRRALAGALASLVLAASAQAASPPPPPAYSPPPPPAYDLPPPAAPPPGVLLAPAPPPPLPLALRVVYAPFYAAGLVLRYGVYYLLVAPFEVFGRTVAYGAEGGVERSDTP